MVLQKNKQGYAYDTQKYSDRSQPGLKIIAYRKGSCYIIDRYTGEEQNIGQTITYRKRKPIYGLNYYGIMISRNVTAHETFEFLKKALRRGKSKHRGPKRYKEKYFLYTNAFTEKRGFAEGEENIYYKGELVYIQVYHGGPIVDRRKPQIRQTICREPRRFD